MASAMCQAYPTFYSDYNAKSLFISVSENFYEKCIVTQDYCVSNHSSFCLVENCKFHLVLIGSSLNQILQRLVLLMFFYETSHVCHMWLKYRKKMRVTSDSHVQTCKITCFLRNFFSIPPDFLCNLQIFYVNSHVSSCVITCRKMNFYQDLHVCSSNFT